jgi:hypothetical protein
VFILFFYLKYSSYTLQDLFFSWPKLAFLFLAPKFILNQKLKSRFIELFQVCTNEWKIVQNGGNGWKSLENDESRSEIRPKQTRTAVFVTSFDWCVRQMEFDLDQVRHAASYCTPKNTTSVSDNNFTYIEVCRFP